MTQDFALEARGVSKTFGQGAIAFTALRAVDFAARKGEFVMLEGPSGSGKTTLLSILGCILKPSEGQVFIDGAEVGSVDPNKLAPLRLEKIGFIFQGHNLLASLSSLENIAFPLELAGMPRKKSFERAKELLARVGLEDKAKRKPAELSGGQRQRVAIARALAPNPKIVLADEPTAALDAESGMHVTELLRDLCRERGGTAIVVTHDNRIFGLADRRVHIEDGRIGDGTASGEFLTSEGRKQ